MDFNEFPNEILRMIISMLPTNKDVKNLNQCSRRLYSLCLPKLWNHARLSWSIPRADKDFLQKISHLPIQEIHLQRLSTSLDFDDLQVLPQLKLIHLDYRSNYRTIKPIDLDQLKIPFVLHTRVMDLSEEKYFEELVAYLKSSKLIRSMVIDHADVEYIQDERPQWPLKWFKEIVEHAHVSELSVTCLDVKRDNVKEFVQVISKIKDCRVIMEIKMPDMEDEAYNFYDEYCYL